PVCLVIGVVAGALWPIGLIWIAATVGLMLMDGALAASPRDLTLDLVAPATLSVNAVGRAELGLVFRRRPPRKAEVVLEAGADLAVAPGYAQLAPVSERTVGFTLTPERRGVRRIERAWVRWTGPLGLARRQLARTLDHAIAVTPDIEGVKSEAIRLFSRDALHGLKTQLEAGEGAEFHALRQFQPGMDMRTIDWKRSARHGELLAREHRTERNHPIVLALDCGRSMSEPVLGAARLDWALNASLLLAYVGLKMGDRVALYAFDAKPRLSSGSVSGTRAFGALQALAAGIDYRPEETNYTLGLFTLAERLERRSLVVVFTEFVDAVSAGLMIEAVEKLLARHLVLFVVMRDEELETLRRAEPETPQDVSRAVIAAALLREREVVVARLRQLGVEIVDAPADQVRAEVMNRYLDLKRRNRL
ncbi:MAG: DUF58 domain-containing protein, partial [Caulobacteraceae bacterium]